MKGKSAVTAKTWSDVHPRVRSEVHDLLRRGMLGSIDQAERFRDPHSKHRSEFTALVHDEFARQYREALIVFVGRAAKGRRAK